MLHTLELFFNLIFWASTLKNIGLSALAGINLMIYWTWTRKTLEYLTGLGLILLFFGARLEKY